MTPRRPGPTQAERVLTALQRAGARGITQLDFTPPVCDGLAPILRVASRVNELRRAGHRILATRERTPGGSLVARYTLAPPQPARPLNGGHEGADEEQLGLGVDIATAHRPASAITVGLDGGRR